MILALDVGNTDVVVGCIEDGQISHVFRISTNTAKTAEEYAIQICTILSFRGIERSKIDGAIISSVVPPLTGVFGDAVVKISGVNPVIIGPGVKTGLNILIDDPPTLGSDIVGSAVAALAKYTPPIIIVDLGTATKMFVLNRNGDFIGGAILPGVALSINALSAGTSQLPRVPIEAPDKCISTNTIDCMKSGAIFGSASEIDGMAARFEAELGQQAQIVATGGLAGAIYRHCKRDVVYDPNLVLHGLRIIFEKNRRK